MIALKQTDHTTSKAIPKSSILGSILLLQLILGFLCAVTVPLWMPSDERAHARYILDLMNTHALHVMNIGDPSYEAHQPPLYYAFCALLFAPLKLPLEQIGWGIRITGVVFSVATTAVWFFAFAKRLDKNELQLLEPACAAYAFCPSILAITSSITNDVFAYFFGAILMAYVMSMDFNIKSLRMAASVGLLGALCILSKITTAGTVVACLWYALVNTKTDKVRKLVTTAFVMLSATAPWFIFNWTNYHSLTAVSKLYGSGDRFLQHDHPIRSAKQAYDALCQLVSYHFVPTEFWLNQFKLPMMAKVLLLACFVCGLTRMFFKPKGRYISFVFNVYLANLALWLLANLSKEGFAIRNFFSAYFAFPVALLLLIRAVNNRETKALRFQALYWIVPALFCVGTIYSIFCSLRFSSFGLTP